MHIYCITIFFSTVSIFFPINYCVLLLFRVYKYLLMLFFVNFVVVVVWLEQTISAFSCETVGAMQCSCTNCSASVSRRLCSIAKVANKRVPDWRTQSTRELRDASTIRLQGIRYVGVTRRASKAHAHSHQLPGRRGLVAAGACSVRSAGR